MRAPADVCGARLMPRPSCAHSSSPKVASAASELRALSKSSTGKGQICGMTNEIYMFRKLVSHLCRNPRGLFLVGGAIGVLSGVECLLAAHMLKQISAYRTVRRRGMAAPVKARLKIAQTRSDLGYVYWVLRQTGTNPNYALFDTWQEAMDEASRRLQAYANRVSQPRLARDLVPA